MKTTKVKLTKAQQKALLSALPSMHKMAAMARRGVMIRERKYGFIPDHKKTLPEELRSDQ